MLPRRYFPRKIEEITRNDERISVVGVIDEIKDSSIILSNSGKKLEIMIENKRPEDDMYDGRDRIKEGKTVRVFCSVNKEKVSMDLVQDLNGTDLNLLKTVEELYLKAGI